ncbi:hypothetical protein MJI95_33180, partial [Salmonella enterica subsp. enterica serovar Kentucky]|nr:hypothetical protein [Salmonella enterica subsp. enterica serovar Kentucky]
LRLKTIAQDNGIDSRSSPTRSTRYKSWWAQTRFLLRETFYYSVGVDGISLTVGEVTPTRFCVHLIPETLERTTLGRKKLGERVNIEIDPQTQAVVDTVERVLAARENAVRNQADIG